MADYNVKAQKSQQENTKLFTVLPATTIAIAAASNYDITGLDNPSAIGAVIFIKLDSEVGVAGLTPSLFVPDAAGTAFVFRTEAELTASGTVAYVYYPGVSTGATSINGADITAAANMIIPRNFGIRLNKSTGDSDQTFSAEVYMMYLV